MSLSAESRTPTARTHAHALGRARLLLRAPGHLRWLIAGRIAAWRERSEMAVTLERVRQFTMVPEKALLQLGRQVRQTLAEGVPGHFVECGAWRGGSGFLMADLLRRSGVTDRKVWLFDSFQGHRSPEEIDGPAALTYSANTGGPEYFDNCRVDVDDVRRSAEELGLAPYTEIVRGWFEESLPAERERIGPIALLRVDCDWHSSVRTCLDQLYDQVSDGGLIIFDDYYGWDGCTIAVHEFLAERRLPHPLTGDGITAYFRKTGPESR